MHATPRSQKPALWAGSMRLAVEIEQAVRGFSRLIQIPLVMTGGR